MNVLQKILSAKDIDAQVLVNARDALLGIKMSVSKRSEEYNKDFPYDIALKEDIFNSTVNAFNTTGVKAPAAPEYPYHLNLTHFYLLAKGGVGKTRVDGFSQLVKLVNDTLNEFDKEKNNQLLWSKFYFREERCQFHIEASFKNHLLRLQLNIYKAGELEIGYAEVYAIEMHRQIGDSKYFNSFFGEFQDLVERKIVEGKDENAKLFSFKISATMKDRKISFKENLLIEYKPRSEKLNPFSVDITSSEEKGSVLYDSLDRSAISNLIKNATSMYYDTALEGVRSLVNLVTQGDDKLIKELIKAEIPTILVDLTCSSNEEIRRCAMSGVKILSRFSGENDCCQKLVNSAAILKIIDFINPTTLEFTRPSLCLPLIFVIQSSKNNWQPLHTVISKLKEVSDFFLYMYIFLKIHYIYIDVLILSWCIRAK